jgi:hypothetical protein
VRLRAPTNPGWKEVPTSPRLLAAKIAGAMLDVATFDHVLGIRVVSSVDAVAMLRGSLVPQWHVSYSFGGRRASAWVDRKVRTDFEMGEAEEDNHVLGGVVRNLWLAIPPEARAPCECKDEPETREAFGGDAEEGDEYVVRGETP